MFPDVSALDSEQDKVCSLLLQLIMELSAI